MVCIVHTSFIKDTLDTHLTYLVHLVPAYQTWICRLNICNSKVNAVCLGYGLFIGKKKTFVEIVLGADK